jgi:hypothetical protein
MEDTRIGQVKDLHNQLRSFTHDWAARKEVDMMKGDRLREEILRLNHQRYVDLIPIYRDMARDLGAPANPDLDFIAAELVSTDDIFKSYNPACLEAKDFTAMTRWLETLHTAKIDIRADDVNTVSGWIARLAEGRVFSTFSSGTTGRLSFVPRDEYNWDNFLNNSAGYIAGLFAGLDMSYENFDSMSLSFKGGNMGVGLVGQRLSRYAKNSYFLYEAEISPDVLKVMRKEKPTPEEKKALDDYYDMILSHAGENFDRIIGNIFESTLAGKRKVKIFGAPFQMKQLCERMIKTGRTIQVLPQSTLSFGGGWKTFEGEKIDRDDLIRMIREALGVEEKYIFEGYSMTEMNVSLMRCPGGRYHIPPLVQAVVYDAALQPLKGKDITGTFGYLDPFATSYPGFIITGDQIRLVDEACSCGRRGPAIVGEVSRAPGREVKGCGGIMSAMKA